MPKLERQSGVTRNKGNPGNDDFMACMDATRNFGLYAVGRKLSDDTLSTIGHSWWIQ